MNPGNPPPDAAPAVSPACARLVHNRARLAGWIEQDRVSQAHPSLGGWAARAVLPLLSGLRQHPTASLALGALAQAWLRPPTAVVARPLETQALGAALTAVRRHPRTTVALAAVAGAAWWWIRSRARAAPPP